MKKIMIIAMLAVLFIANAADFSRIDVNGFKTRNKLTPVTEEGFNKFINPPNTMRDYYLTSNNFSRPHTVWHKTTLAFKAEKDGNVELMLLANWVSKENLEKLYHGKYPRVIYTSVKAISGTTIINGDFAESKDGKVVGWTTPEGSDYKKIKINDQEHHVVIGRTYAPVTQLIPVKAGENVVLEFEWALESSIEPQFWIAADGGDIYTDIVKKKSFSTHPCLFGNSDELKRLTQKFEAPYFKDFTKDVIVTADDFIKRFGPNYLWICRENQGALTMADSLISAYYITGDKKYSRCAIDSGLTFINKYYLKIPITSQGKFKNIFGLESFTFRPLVMTYDMLFDQMSEEERVTYLKMLAYLGDLSQRMTENPEFTLGINKNYVMSQMGTFALIACATKDELPKAKQWMEISEKYMNLFAQSAIDSDGMFHEGSTYFSYTASSLLLGYYALEKSTGRKIFQKTNLDKAIDFLTWSLTPDGKAYDMFGDSSIHISTDIIIPVLQYFNPEETNYYLNKTFGKQIRSNGKAALAWLFATEPHDNTMVLENGKIFKDHGFVAFTDGDAKLFFYAANYKYAAHSQADRGHFNYYAKGFNWAGDSGYGNDGKQPNSAASAEAHSQVFIDGKGQSYIPQVRVSATFSRFEDYLNTPSIGYAVANQKPAYDYGLWYTRDDGRGVRNNILVQKAFRHMIFMRSGSTPHYLLVFDDIRKDNDIHKYEWRMQLNAGGILSTKDNKATIKPLAFNDKLMDNYGTGTFENPNEAGWQIFRYKTGFSKFTFDVPEAGRYYLWSKGALKSFCTDADCDIILNGKSLGRGKIAQSYYPTWQKISNNLNLMTEALAFDLKKGQNTLEIRNIYTGFWVEKYIFVKEPDLGPNEIEKNSVIALDYRNMSSSAQVKTADAAKPNLASCDVIPLYPNNINMSQNLFQPTKQPLHSVLSFDLKTVEPQFLNMLYPYDPNAEQPIIEKNDNIIKIKWSKSTDIILLNVDKKLQKAFDIESDGQLFIIRKDEILVTKATIFKYKGKTLYQGKAKTLSLYNGKLSVSNFEPATMKNDSL